MFEITAGDKESADARLKRDTLQSALIALGTHKKTIYLNGGSDTRKAVREYYHDLYANSNFYSVESNAFSVTIRGASR